MTKSFHKKTENELTIARGSTLPGLLNSVHSAL